jgi:ABC-type transport system substrate-binding protein
LKRLLAGTIILALALSLTLSGCSPKQQVHDTLTWAGQIEPKTMDPINTGDMTSAMVQRQIFQGLFDFDENCVIVPELAESYEVTENSTVWTIQLRQGVKFHDGTPFNAEAVKINFERAMNPEATYVRRTLFTDISNIECVSEYEVRITLKKPFGAFLANLAHYGGKFHSPASLTLYGDDVSRNPVGTGPYKFVEWIPGDRIVMGRNDDYWGDKPYFKTIVYKPVPEDASRVMMLESGDVDVIYPVAVQDIARLSQDDRFTVKSVPSMTNLHFQINMTRKPLDDKRVRQALNYAIDLNAICANIYQGQAVPLDSPISPALWGHYAVGAYPYDPEKAKALLAEAGIEPGELTLKMYIPEGRYLMASEVAEAVVNYLKDVGVNVDLTKYEAATYWDFFKKGPAEATHDLLMLGWAPSTADPDWGMRPMFHSSMKAPVNWNSSFYGTPEVDRLLELGMTASTPEERLAAYEDVQKIVMEDAPWIFLAAYNVTGAWKKEIKNIWVQPTDQMLVRGAFIEG